MKKALRDSLGSENLIYLSYLNIFKKRLTDQYCGIVGVGLSHVCVCVL